MEDNSLEGRAKKLLRWKIKRQGIIPNPFIREDKIRQELSYLLEKGYVVKGGETPKSLFYSVTTRGRKWAMGI